MRKNLQAIIFIKELITGIIAAVMTLLIIYHGASISNVSLLMGLYPATVIVAEFPTGVFADLYGRKRSFLVSVVFSLSSYTLLLSQSIVPLAAAMLLAGLGRAFASGSMDAIAIDAAKDDAELVAVTSRLTILQSAGLALGALAGGVLAGISSGYIGNLIAAITLALVLGVLTLFTVKEAPGEDCEPDQEMRLGTHIKESLSFLKRRGTVRMLLVLLFLSGFAMLALETYWQPALAALEPPSWMLGVVSSLGFLSIIAGSWLTEQVLTRKPKAGALLTLLQKALVGACLIGLTALKHQVSFAAGYGVLYIFLGGASVAEDTLLNREAPSAQRASIISLFSFTLQAGGLLASLIGFLITANTDFRMLWLLAGTLLIVASAAFSLVRRFGKAQPLPEPEEPADLEA